MSMETDYSEAIKELENPTRFLKRRINDDVLSATPLQEHSSHRLVFQRRKGKAKSAGGDRRC